MIYIVGAGLFGSIIRDRLQREGVECLTIDARIPLAASPAAGCLTKPSWVSCLGERHKEGLQTLDEIYGLKKMPVEMFGKLKIESIYHINPSRILTGVDIESNVTSIDPDAGVVRLSTGEELTGTIIVAAGIWSATLLGERFGNARMVGQKGVSLLFGVPTPQAKMRIWAPYKQSVSFEIDPGVTWFGDGTSIQPQNWTVDHDRRVLEHARLLDQRLIKEVVIKQTAGIRPYVDGESGWCKQVGTRCWVSTGGAKNGMVLAALHANKVLFELRGKL